MSKQFPENRFLPIAKEIPSNDGYLIRPYVQLSGQRNGYKWSKESSGLWRSFLGLHIKYLSCKTIGRSSNNNLEAKICKAFYEAVCEVDDWKIATEIAPYVHTRYFDTNVKLPSLTAAFKHHAASYAVGIDCHEVKCHSRFADMANDTKHKNLIAFNNGSLNNENGEEHYYLKFEVRAFDPNMNLEPVFERITKRQVLEEQKFRDWIHVVNEINDIKVIKLLDEMGHFYVSDTRFYIPIWLRDPEQHQAIVRPIENPIRITGMDSKQRNDIAERGALAPAPTNRLNFDGQANFARQIHTTSRQIFPPQAYDSANGSNHLEGNTANIVSSTNGPPKLVVSVMNATLSVAGASADVTTKALPNLTAAELLGAEPANNRPDHLDVECQAKASANPHIPQTGSNTASALPLRSGFTSAHDERSEKAATASVGIEKRTGATAQICHSTPVHPNSRKERFHDESISMLTSIMSATLSVAAINADTTVKDTNATNILELTSAAHANPIAAEFLGAEPANNTPVPVQLDAKRRVVSKRAKSTSSNLYIPQTETNSTSSFQLRRGFTSAHNEVFEKEATVVISLGTEGQSAQLCALSPVNSDFGRCIDESVSTFEPTANQISHEYTLQPTLKSTELALELDHSETEVALAPGPSSQATCPAGDHICSQISFQHSTKEHGQICRNSCGNDFSKTTHIEESGSIESSSSQNNGVDKEKIASLRKWAESILQYCEDLTELAKIQNDYLNLKEDAIKKTKQEFTRFNEKGIIISRTREAKLMEIAKHESIGLIEKNAVARLARETFNRYAVALRSKRLKLRVPIFDTATENNFRSLIQIIDPLMLFPPFESIEDFLVDDNDINEL